MKQARQFEKPEGTLTKFWHIEQDHATYVVRWGTLGAESDVRVQPCDSVEEATSHIDRLAMNLADIGFAEVGAVATPAALAWSSELEAAILRDPTSDAARQVYGDWLQQQGNPLGDLVALQAAQVRDASVEAAFASLFGSVAKNFRVRHSQRPDQRGLELTFRTGFVDSIWCGNGDANEATAALDAVLSSPAARFVRSVTLGLTRVDESRRSSQGLIDTVVRLAPQLIERLEVADFRYPFDDAFGSASDPVEAMMSHAETGNVGRVWSAMPTLREVTVRGTNVGLGTISAPALRAFTVETDHLSPSALSSIEHANWPLLKTLKLWLGVRDDVDRGLQPILEGTGLVALEHLGLMNSSVTNWLVGALASAKVLRRLRTLDLSKGTLTDTGVAELQRHRAAFAHLERIDLRENLITDVNAASKLDLPLVLDNQRWRHEGGDFPAVTE